MLTFYQSYKLAALCESSHHGIETFWFFQGSIESYNKVAGHLAKVPKSVASTDEYLKAISPQVLPLLGLKHKPKDLMLEKISFAALNNVFHTSLSLTCKLFVIEPKLATKYLVQPMMKPLLALSLIQKSTDTVENLSPRPAGADHSEWLTEDEVVDSSVQLGVLLTAGCQGSLEAREAILCEARGVAPLFLKLHFQLASREYSSPIGNTKNASSVQKNWALEGKDVRKGFLNKGLGSNGPDEQAYEDESNLSKLKSSLADVVMAVVNQPVESALPCVLPFLLERTMDMVRWPQEEGEIWDTLQSKGFQSKSKVMYLSRLLLMVENWPLVVALLGKLLHKILSVPWSWLKGGGTEFPEAAELLRHMQDFEELNTEVGMKALEHDTCGAASLVKTVLEDELVLHDEDILELVLHMVYSVLKGIRTTGGDDSQTSSAHGTILNDLQSSLRKVYGNAHVGEKLRQMSFTLAKEVSALCNTSF
ncbi:hypothetical protein L7F22_035099 [Adiantum nelumboides]|nr:hypothetical protein [Adiantum nelumboides]